VRLHFSALISFLVFRKDASLLPSLCLLMNLLLVFAVPVAELHKPEHWGEFGKYALSLVPSIGFCLPATSSVVGFVL
jgi:hypothetical protein